MAKQGIIKIKNGEKYFFRFTINQRIQHIILATCVITLALTGFPLKFHDALWAHRLYALVGGIKFAPVIHKTAGVIMLLLFVYHIFYTCYVAYFGQIVPLREKEGLSVGKLVKVILSHPFIPNLKDLKDITGLFKYLFFLTDKRPEGAEWTWKEKLDYWGPFWGIPILGVSGLIMWNKELASQFLPGEVINFCLIAHSDEALLAALFLFIWHWYNVHFSTTVFPMGKVFLTGYLPENLMIEEHYEYYVEVMKKEGFEHEILPPHDVVCTHESVEGGSLT